MSLTASAPESKS